jgi:hypothetical protein
MHKQHLPVCCDMHGEEPVPGRCSYENDMQLEVFQ